MPARLDALRLAVPPRFEAAFAGDGDMQAHSDPGASGPRRAPGSRVWIAGPPSLRVPIPAGRRRSARESAVGMSPADGTPAWTLIQALEVLKRIGEQVSSDFVFHEGDGEPIVTSAASVAVLKRIGAELIDEAAQLESLVERLPDAEVRVTAEDVQTGAARQLAEGVLDVRTALLAASVLPVATGWPALASALRHSDAHRFWDGTTVADLLGRFRGATPEAVGRVLEQAQLGSSTLWVALAARTVARLAEVLAGGVDSGAA